MKILYLVHADNYHLQNWVPALNREGIDVHLATFQPFDVPGAKSVITLNPSGDRVRYRDFFMSTKQVKRILEELTPDLLFCSFATTYGLLGQLTGFRPRVVQTWSRDVGADPLMTAKQKALIKFLGSYILKSADGITTDSFFYRKHLLDKFPQFEPKTIATSWGIPTARLYKSDPVRTKKAWNLPLGSKIITSVRGLTYYYQPELIIPTLLRLVEGRDDLHALLLTLNHKRGPKTEHWVKKAYNHPNIKVIDRLLDRNEMNEIWSISDFFVSMPLFDGVSESVQEGAFLGSIPIVNEIPANRELLEGGLQAFVTEQVTPETDSLVEVMEMAMNQTENILGEMKKKNRTFVEQKRNVQNTALKLAEFLRGIASIYNQKQT